MKDRQLTVNKNIILTTLIIAILFKKAREVAILFYTDIKNSHLINNRNFNRCFILDFK